jgi:hypothetical protein
MIELTIMPLQSLACYKVEMSVACVASVFDGNLRYSEFISLSVLAGGRINGF